MTDQSQNVPDPIYHPPRTPETHLVDELEMQRIKETTTRISITQSIFALSISALICAVLEKGFLDLFTAIFATIAVCFGLWWKDQYSAFSNTIREIYERKIEPDPNPNEE